jgi:hypothetical protein
MLYLKADPQRNSRTCTLGGFSQNSFATNRLIFKLAKIQNLTDDNRRAI